MILQVSPTSPWWEHVAAGALLAIHVGAGAIGLMSGTAAVLATKGGKLHRAAGTAFFASMLVMSGIGMAVAPFLPQLGSEIGGSFTFYLVFTGWLAVWRAPNSIGSAERVAAVCALLIALAAASFGVRATRLPGGELDGTPAGPYFAFATLAALAGALDWRVVVKGGLSGTSRLARHLWRMLVALLIAAISFFLGQSQVLPTSLQHSKLLFAPEVAILVVLAFWMTRTRLGPANKRTRDRAPNN